MTVSFRMMGRMMTFNADSKPRHVVFSKIESLISRMNDQKTGGIPLRIRKNFLSTVQSSFSGNDLVTWLSNNLCSGDVVEALHLASFLCMYGYIYPVDLKSYVVRDDKSVLYRFQGAYYWPSINLKLTNEKFIIYLLKRSKRNKQKHGLEEYEQNALSKLQIVFSDKMGFVKSQADEQVKYIKGMDKSDKTSHDSQERAFWRVQRPPPNHVKCLEEGPSRCFQPSQMLSRKKKNRDIKLIEVHYLRRAVGRPRLKFSKSIDIFVQRNENYLEYDPFLDPLAAQPGNPWYTEDETIYWEINRNMVDIPTVMRIRKWGLSFADLLKDETGRSEFEQFLKKEYSQENIRFYKACKELLICPLSKVNTLKASIESEFLTPGAPCEVNVDCKTMESVTQQLQTQKNVHRHIFQPAMDHVYALMKKDSYTRFIRSDQYNSLLAISQGHYTKKRFFSFGSNKRRIPSPQPKRRGSSSSGDATGGEDSIGGHSYHSYSTGNLREFDEKPKRSFRQSNSPSMRRRAEDADRLQSLKDDRRRSNLEVPQSSGFSTSTTEANRKSENMNTCLAISVPRNVIAPWEGNS